MTTIYLVDDSELVRERLHVLLGGVSGVRITGEAGSSTSAIAGILATRPDIVVLDLNLEEGSGLDVLRAVRKCAPEVDCYVLSNHADLPYRQLAERLGARGYFDKSTEFERVRDLVAARAASHPKN
jgi:DNA-binding NarL/FixJ family response regulator